MSRALTDTPLTYKTLKVNKVAFEELVNRGYDMQELFNNLILSLLQIETDSEIRYTNAKNAIQNLIDEKEKKKQKQMQDEEAKAELIRREKMQKIDKIAPAAAHLTAYLYNHKQKLNDYDTSLCAYIQDEIIRHKEKYKLDIEKDINLFDVHFIKVIRGYLSDVKMINTDTLKNYLIEHF